MILKVEHHKTQRKPIATFKNTLKSIAQKPKYEGGGGKICKISKESLFLIAEEYEDGTSFKKSIQMNFISEEG